MRIRFKYKITPALIIAILVVVYYVLHYFLLFGEVIKNNDSDKEKVKEKEKIEQRLTYIHLSDKRDRVRSSGQL